MKLNIGVDFAGVGAFEQALIRLGINYNSVFACDMDVHARNSYIANYGKPKYFPLDVYDRKIPKESLDIYMTSPPCQGFSIAGKRGGSILFLNSHEFIQKNKPRFFIFENVKGLLSHDKKNKEQQYGNTFNEWINYLGGKSVNGNTVIFPHEKSVPYHIYHKVLNAKNYGVPQNRERVFIIGIRDDEDNIFTWPKPFFLTKRLKDVLEKEVDPKYYLSDKMMDYLNTRSANFNGGKIKYKGENDTASCITKSSHSLDISDNIIKEGFIKQDTQGSQVYSDKGVSPTLSAGTHGYAQGYVRIGAIRGINPQNPKSRVVGLQTEQMLELNMNGTSNALTTVQKDNVVVQLNPSRESGGAQPYKQNRIYDADYLSPVLDTECGRPKYKVDYKIRRLTPRECFRLMDFPDSFKFVCSNTQLYKQAGNSIVVNVLAEIIKKLKL